MRPTEDQVQRKVIRSDLQTTQFSLKVDETTFRQQIDGLYSDKAAAVTREIIANAIDAHAMVGNTTDSVEVTLPSAWLTNFIVRDYGPGMPHDFVMENYTCLGVSTKTRTNVATGMFGYGSKTPFAVSDAFTVAVFDNGTQRTYSAFFNEDGIPSLSAHPSVPTTERNGTRVSVNVKGEYAGGFEAAITKQWGVFFDKNINWNNTLPKSNDDARSIIEHVPGLFALRKEDQGGYSYWGARAINRLYVRQGSAMYPAHELVGALNTDYKKVAGSLTDTWMIDVPIGTASPTPSREAIQWNAATRALVTDIANAKLAQLYEKLSDEARGCDDIQSYAKVLMDALDKQAQGKPDAGASYSNIRENVDLFAKVVIKNFEDKMKDEPKFVTSEQARTYELDPSSLAWSVGRRVTMLDGTTTSVGVTTAWTMRLSVKRLTESGVLDTDRAAIYEAKIQYGPLGVISAAEAAPAPKRFSAPRGRSSGDSADVRPFDYVLVIPTGTLHWNLRFQKLIAQIKTRTQVNTLDRDTRYYVIVTPKSNIPHVAELIRLHHTLVPGRLVVGQAALPELTPDELKIVAASNAAASGIAPVKRHPSGYALFSKNARHDLTPDLLADDSILFIEAPAPSRGNHIPSAFKSAVLVKVNEATSGTASTSNTTHPSSSILEERLTAYCAAAKLDKPTIYIVSPRIAELVKDTWTNAEDWITEVIVKATKDAAILDASAFTNARCDLSSALANDLTWCNGGQTIPVWHELAKTTRGRAVIYAAMKQAGKVKALPNTASEFTLRRTATALLTWFSNDLVKGQPGIAGGVKTFDDQVSESTILFTHQPNVGYTNGTNCRVGREWTEFAELLASRRRALIVPLVWPMGTTWTAAKDAYTPREADAVKEALTLVAIAEKEQASRTPKVA